MPLLRSCAHFSETSACSDLAAPSETVPAVISAQTLRHIHSTTTISVSRAAFAVSVAAVKHQHRGISGNRASRECVPVVEGVLKPQSSARASIAASSRTAAFCSCQDDAVGRLRTLHPIDGNSKHAGEKDEPHVDRCLVGWYILGGRSPAA